MQCISACFERKSPTDGRCHFGVRRSRCRGREQASSRRTGTKTVDEKDTPCLPCKLSLGPQTSLQTSPAPRCEALQGRTACSTTPLVFARWSECSHETNKRFLAPGRRHQQHVGHSLDRPSLFRSQVCKIPGSTVPRRWRGGTRTCHGTHESTSLDKMNLPRTAHRHKDKTQRQDPQDPTAKDRSMCTPKREDEWEEKPRPVSLGRHTGSPPWCNTTRGRERSWRQEKTDRWTCITSLQSCSRNKERWDCCRCSVPWRNNINEWRERSGPDHIRSILHSLVRDKCDSANKVKMNQLSHKRNVVSSWNAWKLSGRTCSKTKQPWKKRPKLERADRIARWTLVGHVLGSQTKASHRRAVRIKGFLQTLASLTSDLAISVLRKMSMNIVLTQILTSLCSRV